MLLFRVFLYPILFIIIIIIVCGLVHLKSVFLFEMFGYVSYYCVFAAGPETEVRVLHNYQTTIKIGCSVVQRMYV